MRRWLSLVFLSGCLFPLVCVHAETVTPAEARASAADAEQSLVELNYYITDSYFHKGAFDEAAAILDRIIAIRPAGADPYATAAWLLWSSKKTDEATRYIDRMIAANAKDPMAYFEAGVFYIRLKNDEKAVTYLEKGVALGMPTPQRHLYGLTLTRLGRTAKALDFWRQVLASDPKDEVAKQQIAKLTAPPPAPKTDEKK